MANRLQPSSNIFIPGNFGRNFPGFTNVMFPNYQNSGILNIPYPNYNYQQQQQSHNILSNASSQQQQQSIQAQQQQQQQQQSQIQSNNSSVTSTSTSSSSSSSSSNTTKTNTPYTIFTNKNLESASSYFSECTSKDYSGHKKNIKTVGWNCDGKKIAGCSYDCITRIWGIDTQRGKELELKGHTDAIECLQWHPTNSDILATASSDKTIKIWDIRTPSKPTSTINTPGENINLCWYPDGSIISTGSKDDIINIYDAKSGKVMKNMKFNDEVNEFSWDPSGELFILTTGSGNIEVYRYQVKINDLKFLKVFNAHSANIYCLDFHPSKKYFAVGSADSLVSFWDLEEMCCIKTFSKLVSPVRSISFSFDGQFIASTSEDNQVDISHVDSGQSVHQITSEHVSSSLAWSPTQPLIAIAYEGKDQKDCGTVKVFGFHS